MAPKPNLIIFTGRGPNSNIDSYNFLVRVSFVGR